MALAIRVAAQLAHRTHQVHRSRARPELTLRWVHGDLVEQSVEVVSCSVADLAGSLRGLHLSNTGGLQGLASSRAGGGHGGLLLFLLLLLLRASRRDHGAGHFEAGHHLWLLCLRLLLRRGSGSSCSLRSALRYLHCSRKIAAAIPNLRRFLSRSPVLAGLLPRFLDSCHGLVLFIRDRRCGLPRLCCGLVRLLQFFRSAGSRHRHCLLYLCIAP
mmetsp:Transcript_10203/g.41553  ORF Transcript_10203/g.41553 Transcript_10203/m.41553 type:complete len:215 (-) Transcript_10203:1959-2603(-)